MGDCDDVATFESALFASLAFPTKLVAIKTEQGNDDFLHVFVQSWIGNGGWMTFDPTVPVQQVGVHAEYGRLEMMI